MRKIQFGKPLIGLEEKNAVQEVLNGDILVHGPKAVEFENAVCAFTSGKKAVAVSSCTAALHLSYFYLGIKSGDEVIVPAQTHVATAHAVEMCSGKPVFVDCETKTGNIDISQIENHITSKTRALSVVHYLGMPVEMDRIMKIAKKHSLFVVEDCALALGARFKGIHAGLYGDVGCFSFYPVKHITTAEGGILLTQNEQIAAKVSRQKAFGLDRNVGERKVPGIYDVTMLGFNYRLNEIGAAIGIEQMKKLPGILAVRKENYEKLTECLREIDEIELLQSTHSEFQSSYYCHSIILKEKHAAKREKIIENLNMMGVGTSVYYPAPVPLLSYYREKYGYKEIQFPTASRISNNSIALPVGAHLNADDMVYIGKCVKESIIKSEV
ncbi:MAG: DegT/DnrJ/EryC1/StrS family aminotransferase [Candidatus Riflebacteria bacterium]|nr:DegT/DnrJ/EryC1/StrS family aminotransferase [Candidatus Riflebacteria bacterium]